MAEKLVLFFSLLLLPTLTPALSYCGEPCQTLDDCRRPLICRKGNCTDDPYARPTICPGSILAPPSQRGPLPPSPRSPPPPPPPAVSCNQSGTVICSEKTYPTYNCSPPITNNTPPILTYRNFSKRGASKCDGKIHENTEFVVALSTGWYAGGSRCGRMIRISANGRTTTAKVVDECDSRNGCDMEHDFQPPCGNNVIAASDAVWNALGLNLDVNQLDITWSMV